MKKLITAAALLVAVSSFAQAQGRVGDLANHPDARNDRVAEAAVESRPMRHHAARTKHSHRSMKSHRHMRAHPLAAPSK